MLRNCIVGVLVAIGVRAGAQSGPYASYRISPSGVAVTVSRAGMHVTARQVHLDCEVWSASAHPDMELLSAQTAPDKEHVWVRIGCRQPRECRPFYATVAWNGPLPVARDASQSKVPVHSKSYSPPVMRMGDHATLVVDSPRSHIEIAVIAMQNGAVGQVIRLATPDRKQFFRGLIVNKSTLTGAL